MDTLTAATAGIGRMRIVGGNLALDFLNTRTGGPIDDDILGEYGDLVAWSRHVGSLLFNDESKNRSRRWCSMEDCGSAEKVRRFVARRAGRRLP